MSALLECEAYQGDLSERAILTGIIPGLLVIGVGAVCLIASFYAYNFDAYNAISSTKCL